jgi:hypothetical protein
MSAAFAGPCAIAAAGSNVAANTLGTTHANNVLTVIYSLISGRRSCAMRPISTVRRALFYG